MSLFPVGTINARFSRLSWPLRMITWQKSELGPTKAHYKNCPQLTRETRESWLPRLVTKIENMPFVLLFLMFITSIPMRLYAASPNAAAAGVLQLDDGWTLQSSGKI